ncbi:MAG: small nuclear ribonucleoprotein [Candidatus Aenigmarchaeota archaeon]|nr:small nuclear ribonucleoprotein [Candidatus Aenigmarchaeota archaeon]
MNDFRPLNKLDNFQNKKIEILLKNTSKITGVMKAYDLNLNIHLEDAEEMNSDSTIKLGTMLLRGSMIININEAQ